MAAFTKQCPKCPATPFRTAKSCTCGHRFTKGGPNKPRKAKEATDENNPEFSCGPSSDGGFVLFWPQKGDFITLSPSERELVAQSVGAPRVVV